MNLLIDISHGTAISTLVTILGVIGAIAILRKYFAERARAEKYRFMCESAPEPFLTVDGDGRIVWANRQTDILFGFQFGALVGKQLSLLIPDTSWRRSLQTNEKAAFELRAEREDGTGLFVSITLAPIKSRSELFMVVVRDITKAKQVEHTLRENEIQLRLLVQQIPAILWATDKQLRITSALGAGLAAFGLDKEQFVGSSMLDNLSTDASEVTPVSAHMKALRGQSLNYEMSCKGRSFQVQVEPFRNANQEITGTISLVLDVSDRKRAMVEICTRARQQAAVADFGHKALASDELGKVMIQAADVISNTLNVEFAEVWESAPQDHALVLRAAIGWPERQLNHLRVGTGMQSMPGYALHKNEPVILNNEEVKTPFNRNGVPRERSVVSGLAVVIRGSEDAYGVLSAFSIQQREFTKDDVHFMQSIANLLSTAIARRDAQATQARLLAILEATSEFVCMADCNKRMLYLNRAGRRLMGIGPEEDISQRSLSEFFSEKAWSEVVIEGLSMAIYRQEWNGESALLSPERGEIPVIQTILAHKGPTGAVEFFSILTRDMNAIRLKDGSRLTQCLRGPRVAQSSEPKKQSGSLERLINPS